MVTFDESFSRALSGRKYDVLTGRLPNLREKITEAMQYIYENIIKPVLSKVNIRLPDIGSVANPDMLKNIFIATAFVLLLLAVFFISVRLKRRSYRNKTIQEIFEDLKSSAVTYEKLLQDADNLAKKGFYRDAIRYEYISLLWVLNKHGVIYLTDYKTNSQLKNELQKNAPPIHERFSGIVNMFNISWFGHKKISEESYRENRTGINELIGEAHKYEKTA